MLKLRHLKLDRADPKGLLGIAADCRAATAVEFGFVSIPFAALMVAILQTSTTFFAQQNLETVNEKVVRQLMTGQAQKANMTASQFKTMACGYLPNFLKCANLLIDVQSVSDFSSANTAMPTITYDSNGNVNNSFSFAPGGSGSINVVRLMYIWRVGPGPLGFNISNMPGQRRMLFSTAVFKTESY